VIRNPESGDTKGNVESVLDKNSLVWQSAEYVLAGRSGLPEARHLGPK